MAVPDFQTLMLPLLKTIAASERPIAISEARDALAKEFKLTEDELEQRVPSGKQRLIDNRVGWARTYLLKTGLISSPARAIVQLTDEGRKVLSSNPQRIDLKFLSRYPALHTFRNKKIDKDAKPSIAAPVRIQDDQTPEDRIAAAVAEYNDSVAGELLDRLQSGTPGFFEEVVVQLLVAMNYGGGLEEAGQVLGRSGDGGIDGVIKEDRLGLDAVYIQAKRYKETNSIGRPQIQAFVGALSSKKVRKGVFITLSSFTREAYEYIKEVDYRIVLIDGEELVQLMIEHDVGIPDV